MFESYNFLLDMFYSPKTIQPSSCIPVNHLIDDRPIPDDELRRLVLSSNKCSNCQDSNNYNYKSVIGFDSGPPETFAHGLGCECLTCGWKWLNIYKFIQNKEA